ncbi:hypothetical protein B0H12DRAFT_1077879 [Mycena haematopus]|nr:hypothetical protein B0H12DRAFT_1077879 [Mycena haematopus]
MADHTRPLPPFLSPIFLTRRRVIIACTHCRKRKIRCMTPEDPPQNPCDRCVKKGLKCEYVTMATQRDETSTNRSAPIDRRRQASPSPPAGSRHTNYSHSSRPIDPQWGGNQGRDHRTLHAHAHEPGHNSQYRYQPYRTQSAGATPEEYYRSYQMPGLPPTLQPHPYLDLARTSTPIRKIGTKFHNFPPASITDPGAFYELPQWDRIPCFSVLPPLNAITLVLLEDLELAKTTAVQPREGNITAMIINQLNTDTIWAPFALATRSVQKFTENLETIPSLPIVGNNIQTHSAFDRLFLTGSRIRARSNQCDKGPGRAGRDPHPWRCKEFKRWFHLAVNLEMYMQ